MSANQMIHSFPITFNRQAEKEKHQEQGQQGNAPLPSRPGSISLSNLPYTSHVVYVYAQYILNPSSGLYAPGSRFSASTVSSGYQSQIDSDIYR